MYSMEFIKSEILNILRVYSEYCSKNGLRYMLVYGTLLGAVRHKGFIPWDDDIDVGMLSDDYERLERIARENPFLDEQKRYRVLVPGDRYYPYSFVKVVDTKYVLREKNVSDKYNIGLYIDVFRIDNWPENSIKEWYQLKKAHLLLKINEICIRGNISADSKYYTLDKLLKPVDLLFKVFGIKSEKVCMVIDRIASKNRPGGFMGIINEGTGNSNEKQPVKIYQNLSELSFEGNEYPVPAEYEAYLKHVYGDYMKLPPPSERVGHEFDIIDEKVFI